MTSLFFSYSHIDEAMRDRLEVHLAMLKRQGIIDAWHDRRIVAGDEIQGEISTQLEAADIILLLVSPDFLASPYCYDVEMTRAMERHVAGAARVIPVILRPCDWHGAPFGKLLAAPRDGKPISRWPDIDEAFLDVVQAIKRAVSEKGPPARPQTAHPTPTGSAVRPAPDGPRSSNLRLRKEFTEADRDRFVDESFEYMARFFENSLAELQARNAEIETTFRRIDARGFAAVVYRGGKSIARCRIWHGGAHGFAGGIAFSYGDRSGDNSFNESLSVDVDEQGLSLKPLGMAMHFGGGEKRLSQEGAAEYYWSIFIEPLQR